VGVNQWDTEYSTSDYAERLDRIHHVPHHAVIFGYLTYGAKNPKVLDVGCGHGRLLQLLEGLDFSDYLGIDWSARGIEQAGELSVPRARFEVADMNCWDTTERFDAVVMNNSLAYAADPRRVFERALGWLAEGGLFVVAMHRSLGARYLWSLIDGTAAGAVAACAVKDELTGAVWDVKALRRS
jgi:trans-aconitate methyltransferase